MAKPNSRASLIEYCLRSLGAPVIEINVDEQQLEDRIDEALQFYGDYHSDATIRTYFKHEVTQENMDTKSIDLPEYLIFVQRVFPINSATSGSSGGLFNNISYQIHLNDIYNLRQPGDLINYEMSQQFLSLIDREFNGQGQTIRFNRHVNKLYIEMDWASNTAPGRFIIIEGLALVDPSECPDVYNDLFLKRYAKALIKRQWGENLIKFEGVQLPGGVTINGRPIYEDAVAELQKIEEEMDSKYQFPPDMFIG